MHTYKNFYLYYVCNTHINMYGEGIHKELLAELEIFVLNVIVRSV